MSRVVTERSTDDEHAAKCHPHGKAHTGRPFDHSQVDELNRVDGKNSEQEKDGDGYGLVQEPFHFWVKPIIKGIQMHVIV